MKEYTKRDTVKARAHNYYINNKLKWGGKRTPITTYKYHEEWARKNGYRNEELHAENTKRFINDERN